MAYHLLKRIKKFFMIICLFGGFFLLPRIKDRHIQALELERYMVAYVHSQKNYTTFKQLVKYGHNINHVIRQVDYIVIHSTSNPNVDSDSHIKWLNHDQKANAVHYYIDANKVNQALDESVQAWGVGDAKKPTSIKNSNSIQIEICEYSDPVKQQQAIDHTIHFIKNDLLKRYPGAKIVSHCDASGKHCPRILLKNKQDWFYFLNRIQSKTI